jgi:hypothetical protein
MYRMTRLGNNPLREHLSIVKYQIQYAKMKLNHCNCLADYNYYQSQIESLQEELKLLE